jgi:large subunit ribosomal protein L3
MAKGILGQKVGMTQVYNESGQAVPVTVIKAGPCHVLQLRTLDRDGYEAVQLGYRDKKRAQGPRSRPSQASRAERGHVANISSKRSKRRGSSGIQAAPRANCEPKRFIRELRGATAGIEVGQVLTVAALEGVSAVDVTGINKGRGYAGVIKRHGFSGQRATHGVKKVHRHPGSTGMRQTPGRLFKGHCMPGHYGNARTTIRNLKVFKVDAANNLLLLHGAVPGPNGGYLVIRETNKVG